MSKAQLYEWFSENNESGHSIEAGKKPVKINP